MVGFYVFLIVVVYKLFFVVEEDCRWENCTFISTNISEHYQHINFHGYISKLMNIGNNLIERFSLPNCNEPANFELPLLPASYSCEWADCDVHFRDYQIFLDHIKCHINCKEDNIQCKWQGKISTI